MLHICNSAVCHFLKQKSVRYTYNSCERQSELFLLILAYLIIILFLLFPFSNLIVYIKEVQILKKLLIKKLILLTGLLQTLVMQHFYLSPVELQGCRKLLSSRIVIWLVQCVNRLILISSSLLLQQVIIEIELKRNVCNIMLRK